MWGDITREPKRTNRFVLIGGGGGFAGANNIIFTIQEVTLPKMDVGEAKVDFISHQFWYPGKVTWQDVSMTLVDAMDPNTSAVIMDVIAAAGYRFPGVEANTDRGNAYVSSFSKQAFNEALGGIGIREIDFEGGGVGEWHLRNAWIKNVSPGDLTMAEANVLNIKLTIKYDWAEYINLR